MRDGYIALIHPPEGGSAWGVTFPDLPGCVSQGDSFEEAVSNAQEAVSGHIATLAVDGEAIPPARLLTELQADTDFADERRSGAIPVPLKVIDMPAPKERVNIMVDRGVLRRIDEAARSKGLSRSAFIEQAAGRAAQRRFV